MKMVSFLFFMSIAIILYVYFGFPLIAATLSVFFNRKIDKKPITPVVTVLIAAYNEREAVAATVRNKLEQDYPADRLDILVVSDGSTDGTDEVVSAFKDSRVRLLRQEPRAGKTSALNLAVPEVRGSIIVFSDANSIYEPDAIRQLVANFADTEVGYVTGKMIYTKPDGSTIGDGCSAYMKYENVLRKIETRLGSVVGVDGGIDGVRKQLYQPMDSDQLPDFVLPLKVVEQGYRVVYEPKAILRESALKEASDEYRMRVRVSLRAIWALFYMRRLLVLKSNMTFSWQLWSHKALRYSCFIFLITAFFSNLLLVNKNWIYLVAFFLQVCCYIGALLAQKFEQMGKRIAILTFLQYFLLLNAAAAHAFIKFLVGKKQVLWTPRKG
jgi:cellulose synthase/poly-beta-1,6-N-acetylglucosamine synthase-like glycosyltransferase